MIEYKTDGRMREARKPVKTQILSSHTFEYLWEVFARVVRRDSHTAGVTWPCSSNGTGGTGCLLSRYKTMSLAFLCGAEYAEEYAVSIIIKSD